MLPPAGPAHPKSHRRRYTGRMHLKLASRTLILVLCGMAFAVTASAQWQWIDKDGRKVFSDRSPPPDILDKNILKQPAGSKRPPAAPAMEASVAAATDNAAAASPAKAASSANAPRLSGKDAQLEAKKKQAEEEEAARKKAEDEKIAQAKAANCERAKRALTAFDSGARISTTNAKGEREIMDDKARAAETKRLQDIAASDCK